MRRSIIGFMTGTSIDGLDAALVRIDGLGLEMVATLVETVSRPLGELAEPLRALAEQKPITAGEIARLGREFALLHAQAASELARMSTDPIDLIVVHGQTVFHQPPLSWQLMAPAPLAAALDTPVLFDLRSADLAAGGQGAPITPLADWVVFREAARTVAVVNIGGFVNYTLLPSGGGPGSVIAGDVCAGNHVLDVIARRSLGQPYDKDGAAALSGHVLNDALDDLLGVLAAQASGRRSLGTGDEVTSWLGRHRVGGEGLISGADLAATACEALGQTIAKVLMSHEHLPDVVLLAGGGALNHALVAAIQASVSARVQTTAARGVGVEAREAMHMAVLGALCADGVAVTLPGVTGCGTAPLSGTLCPAPRGGGSVRWAYDPPRRD